MTKLWDAKKTIDEFLENLPFDAENVSEVLDQTYVSNNGLGYFPNEDVGISDPAEVAAIQALNDCYEILRAYSFMTHEAELYLDIPDFTGQDKNAI